MTNQVETVVETRHKCTTCKAVYPNLELAQNCIDAHEMAENLKPALEKLRETCPHPSMEWLGNQFDDKVNRCLTCGKITTEHSFRGFTS